MPPAAAALDGGQRVAEPAAPMQQEIFLKDYVPPRYLIDTVHLSFQLWEEATHVVSKLSIRPSQPDGEAAPPMFLHGRADVQLDGVKVDDEEWPPERYQLTDRSLTLLNLPAAAFTLEIRTTIKPQENTLLQGLYKSSGMYCTQCEAEGFRGITFFHDLPDVLSVYTTRVEADRALYPVLLSNGNLVDSGSVPGNDERHFAVFQDPWPKPCYLFALVAGQLGWREDSFTTMGGRKVQLRIYTREEDVPRTAYAMESLVTAMQWDEERFGREYDLNVLNVVAVDDFNMGAMENKGLMVFNSARILACPKTAVDDDFFMVQRVMAHEYFHNWTGNRVTLRDWFQLTLKEGLTVFRDQEFSSDLHSRAVRRIRDVSFLRTTQFPEDAGSMAHPVRPLSYVKMDNFYTSTVYKKGAEVVRLYHTLLGRDGFRKGMDLYFQRHDGQAVTCEEFLAAHADANGADLAAVARWYGQAGTPHLRVATAYSPAQKTLNIRTQQSTPPTPGQPTKGPVMIPLAVGLLSPDGTDIPIRLQGSSKEPCTTLILPCSNDSDEFVIEGCEAPPVPSLLRNFSAPVVMTVEGQTEEDLLFLMHNDSDMFNRWDAAQRLCLSRMLALYHSVVAPDAEVESQLAAAGGVGAELAGAFCKLLEEEGQDRGFVAASIALPGHTELMARLPQADPIRCHKVRQFMRKELSQRLEPQLRAAVKVNDSQPGEAFSPSFEQQSRRALKNAALSLLAAAGEEEMWEELAQRFRAATNMTDQLAALRGLLGARSPQREQCLQEFFDQWQSDRLVMNKWFQEQACCSLENNLGAVQKLSEHPSFSITNPNNCYALLRGFAASPPNFHAADGSGYSFLADMILKVDKVNGVAASKICLVFTSHAQYCRAHQELMLKEVKRIAATDGLSENVLEITNRCLAA